MCRDGATVGKGAFLGRDLEYGVFAAVSWSSVYGRGCEIGCCHFNVIQISTTERPKWWQKVKNWTKDCRRLGEKAFGEKGEVLTRLEYGRGRIQTLKLSSSLIRADNISRGENTEFLRVP